METTMNHSAAQPRRSRRSARLATAIGAGLVGAGVLLTPAVAFADTAQTVQTTDRAGDARAGLVNNKAADLLTAGARIDSSTVTAFFGLNAPPTAADLAGTGTYRYTTQLSDSGYPGITVAFSNTDAALYPTIDDPQAMLEPSAACVAYFGPQAGAGLHGTVTSNAATGELTTTFSKADVNAAVSCYTSPPSSDPLSAGHEVGVTSATSHVQPAVRNPLIGAAIAQDSAGAGPVVTLN